MEFSNQIKDFLKETYPNKNIYEMSLDELKTFKSEVTDKRHEYELLELAVKTCMNAAYGSAANQFFYFFNNKVAADITGECRNLTRTMWNNLENFFHETIWVRKDLWEKFDFALDETKHDWYRTQNISVYSDTDSCDKDSKINIEGKGNISIEDLFKLGFTSTSEIGKIGEHEIVSCPYKILNYKDGKLRYCDVAKIVRHKVTKPKFKIKTKSGKVIYVTGDHSCVVFRNGKQMTVKAKDIDKATDKILVVKD